MVSLRRVSMLTFVLVVLAAASILVAQKSDPLSGTWKLNLAKSKYSPASLAPKSGTTKLEVSGDAIKTTTDGVDAQGRTTHTEYAAKFDGKDYPWKGTIAGKPNLDQDSVSWKKIDDSNYEVVNTLKGQVLTTQRTVVSRDGKTRTNTLTGKNAQSQTINNTQVYERQ